MATLQAIADALGIIEGAAVRDRLMDLYQTKVARTMIARGLLPLVKRNARLGRKLSE